MRSVTDRPFATSVICFCVSALTVVVVLVLVVLQGIDSHCSHDGDTWRQWVDPLVVIEFCLLGLSIIGLSLLFLLTAIHRQPMTEAEVRHPTARGQRWILKEVPFLFQLSPQKNNVPSIFLLVACCLFAFLLTVSQGLKFFDPIAKNLTSNVVGCKVLPYRDFGLPSLRTFFTAMQTTFFALYSRFTLTVQAKFVTGVMAITFTTDMSLWLMDVGREVEHNAANRDNTSNSSTGLANVLLPRLYPFSIEYSALSALFCVTTWLSLGQVARLVRQRPGMRRNEEFQEILQSYGGEDSHGDRQNFRQYTVGLLCGLPLLAAAIVSCMYFLAYEADSNGNHKHEHWIFYVTLTSFHSIEIFILPFLLGCTFFCHRRCRRIRRSNKQVTDILLLLITTLFCCVDDIAVIVYEAAVYKVYKLPPTNAERWIEIADCAVSCMSAVLQSAVLTFAMNWTFCQSRYVWWIKQLTVVLMLMNFADWVIYVLCNHIMLHKKDNSALNTISVICFPFVVFYRFHSAAAAAADAAAAAADYNGGAGSSGSDDREVRLGDFGGDGDTDHLLSPQV